MATRRERVVLDLESNVAAGLTRDAAAAALLKRELNSLSGTAVQTSRSVDGLNKSSGVSKFGKDAETSSKQLDRFTGRLALFAQAAAVLGPALVPIGAVAIPAVTGLAAQLGFAATAGGTAIIAFQGVGDALKALNKAQLEPTAENLQAARVALDNISPAAQQFVGQLHEMIPALKGVRDSAAEGLFPGLTESLDDLERVLPKVEGILHAVGQAMGELAADGAASLASDKWADFFTFIETNAPQALSELGQTVGNLAHGLAELWMAFDPLNDDFSSWMLDASAAFDKWSTNLSKTQGFEDFVAYIRTNGPLVADAMESIGNAVLKIVEATAPLGGPVLQALTGVADAIAAIAGSDAGPAIMGTVTALALLSRGMRTFEAVGKTAWVSNIKGAEGFGAKMAAGRGPMLRSGAAMAGFGLAASGAADGIGLSNTASMALMGTLAGPWGAAVGGAVGLALDLGASQKKTSVDVDALTGTLNAQTGAITANTSQFVAGELEKQGVLKTAQELGLNLADVTAAALGNEAALGRVTAGLQAYQDAIDTGRVGRAGLSVELGKIGDIQQAIGGTSGALTEARDKFSLLSAATSHAATETDHYRMLAIKTAAAAKEQAAALQASREAARATAQGFMTLGNSLNDSKVSLGDWIHQLERQADALRNFRLNAIKAANQGLRQGLIKALQEAGPEGALRLKQLANASEKEIGRANAAWQRGQAEIRRYTDTVGGVPTAHTTTIHTEAKKALAELGSVRSLIASINDKSVTISVHTVRTGDGGVDYLSGGQRDTGADGTTVPKTGRGYADRHPYLLADGEEVISNRFGQADRNRGLLKAINANRLAAGGTAGGMWTSTYSRRPIVPGMPDIGGALSEFGADLSYAGDKAHDFGIGVAISAGGLQAELKVRQKLLSQEMDRDKQRLDMLRQERQSLADAIAARFGDTPFGQQNGQAPTLDTTGMSAEERAAAIAAYNQQYATYQQGNSPTAILQQQLAELREEERLLAILRRMGLGGPALAQVATTASIAEMQALIDSGRGGVAQYEHLLGAVTSGAQQLGSSVGNAVYGADIKEQNRLLNRHEAQFKEMNQRIHSLEKSNKDGHNKTKQAVDHLSGKVANSARTR
ncbi:hypothetical protein [Jatrophihabitans sp.]|uniref:hypothetical protein n=1 Tax=Jatrophihabitans sp. TaxID=1932789 RepID=UPI0030C6668E|nr:hypothetical protein [Jatrophihabitans sp.]